MDDFVLLKISSAIIVGLNQTLMVLGNFELASQTLLLVIGTACILGAFE